MDVHRPGNIFPLTYSTRLSTQSAGLPFVYLTTKQGGNTPGSTAKKPEGAWSADQVAFYLYQRMDEGNFYVICPDNDVTEETDKKRMLWSVGDIVNGRQPLSRWRDEYKEEAAKWMNEQKL